MNNLKDWQIKKENGIFDKRNQVNNLTGKEWLFSTRSVKTKNYLYYFDVQKTLEQNYLDFMPIDLITELILTFSKPETIIIDPSSNFGSIGYATSKAGEKRSYIGFNYDIETQISFNVEFDLTNITFSSDSLSNNSSLPINEKKCILITELIFSSLNSESRSKKLNEFKKNLERTLQILVKRNIIIDYVIIAIQNTKDENSYHYNTKEIFDLLSPFNLLLKSELIWKIHEDEFSVIKRYLHLISSSESDNNKLLNDKRILVFRGK